MSQLKIAAVLSYVYIGSTSIIGLVLTPFIIQKLGTSEYGLYSLIGSFVAYLSLMDLGLNNSVVRFVSKYRAEKNYVEEKKFLGTTMLVYSFISIVLLAVGILMYFNLEQLFEKSLTSDELNKAKIMFLILLFNITITLPGGTFVGICTAYQQYAFPKIVQIIRYLLRSLTVCAILLIGGDAISLVVIDTVFNLLSILITMYFCVYKLNVKFIIEKAYKSKINEIFQYSIWIFIISLVQTFQWNVGQIILGINFNTTIVAVYSVGLMLGSYLGAFAGVLNTLLLPKAASDLANNNDAEALTNTMIRIGRINVFISFVIITGFVLVGKDFILLWLGPSYIKSWDIALLIMLASAVALSQSYGMSILEIKNKIKYRSISVFIFMVLAVAFGWYFSKEFGIYGVLIPITISMLLNTLINNVLFKFHFHFQLIKFYQKTFIFQLLFTLIFILLGLYIKSFVIIDNWISFSIAGTCIAIIYIFSFYFLLFNDVEKKIFSRKSINIL